PEAVPRPHRDVGVITEKPRDADLGEVELELRFERPEALRHGFTPEREGVQLEARAAGLPCGLAHRRTAPGIETRERRPRGREYLGVLRHRREGARGEGFVAVGRV